MTRKLDPILLDLAERSAKQLRSMQAARFGIEMAEDAAPNSTPDLIVLVKFEGSVEALAGAGLRIRSVSGDVATGVIDPRALAALGGLDEVVAVESSRPLVEELDLSLIEVRADEVHVGPPGRRGAGTIVGIIDSGIDFTHPAFLKPDGTTRILAIWDQSLTARAGESAPAGFGYGVEYGQADIDAALAAGDPFAVVRHKDSPGASFHGTHVAGIAAGDGSAAGGGASAGTFIGVAPEADIVVVRNIYRGEFATSAETLDAANYVFAKAADAGKPVVINQSQGDNLGAHDGTSLLEQGLDNLLGGAGRAYVKSAGNAADDRIHAEGTVLPGAPTDLRFSVPATDDDPDVFDIWYPGADAFSVRLRDPDGATTASVAPGGLDTTDMPNGNRVRIDHRANDPRNGDKRIFVIVEPGTAARVRAGNWSIELTGTSVVAGTFHAWIQRGRAGRVARFLAPHESARATISTPGTAREVISVGSYVTRGAGVGSLSSFSSRGPTRDGRASPYAFGAGSVRHGAPRPFRRPEPRSRPLPAARRHLDGRAARRGRDRADAPEERPADGAADPRLPRGDGARRRADRPHAEHRLGRGQARRQGGGRLRAAAARRAPHAGRPDLPAAHAGRAALPAEDDRGAELPAENPGRTCLPAPDAAARLPAADEDRLPAPHARRLPPGDRGGVPAAHARRLPSPHGGGVPPSDDRRLSAPDGGGVSPGDGGGVSAAHHRLPRPPDLRRLRPVRPGRGGLRRRPPRSGLRPRIRFGGIRLRTGGRMGRDRPGPRRLGRGRRLRRPSEPCGRHDRRVGDHVRLRLRRELVRGGR